MDWVTAAVGDGMPCHQKRPPIDHSPGNDRPVALVEVLAAWVTDYLLHHPLRDSSVSMIQRQVAAVCRIPDHPPRHSP